MQVDGERFRVPSDKPVELSAWSPSGPPELEGKKRLGRSRLQELNRRLEALQELLWADGRHRILVVLQAMDTGGKDGTIRHVFDGVNPQGVRVACFKKPTPVELAHDYLWRVHRHTPGNGEIVIFNRSHYEDLLVVRVHNLVPPDVWGRRYRHINEFEKLLTDEGTTIVKFFLHISKQEQKRRLQARLAAPEKNWKFDRGDLAERRLWDEYMAAYEAVLANTSSDWAPWYLVPADRKWFRNLVVSQVLVDTLEGLKLRHPPAEKGLNRIVID